MTDINAMLNNCMTLHGSVRQWSDSIRAELKGHAAYRNIPTSSSGKTRSEGSGRRQHFSESKERSMCAYLDEFPKGASAVAAQARSWCHGRVLIFG
jgi:hypothetical protein